MTLEGSTEGQDETPAPPARTRWSEDTADDDPGLMPPYVPGGGEAAASAGTPPVPPAELDPWAGPPEPAGPEWSPEPPPEPAGEPALEPSPEPFPEPPPSGPDRSPPADDEPFPFEVGGGDAAPFEGGGDSPFPFEGGGEDDFPFAAFDIGAQEAPAPMETEVPGLMPEPVVPESPGAGREVGSPRPADLAARLQGVAEALRTEGQAGVERKMVSGDRFTSLVAGVVAGYLAGLEE